MVGEIVECVHCGAPSPAASRFCPTCGKSFGVNSSDPADGDIESQASKHEAQDAHVQNTDPPDVTQTLPALHDRIPLGRAAMLVLNIVLLAILLGLLISPPQATNEPVVSAPEVPVSATDTPVIATATRGASPTATGSHSGISAATVVAKPAATATPSSLPTVTVVPAPPPPPPSPTPQKPTPTPAP